MSDNLPIIPFGSVDPPIQSSLPAYSTYNEPTDTLNLKSVAQAVNKAKRVAVVCGKDSLTLDISVLNIEWHHRSGNLLC
jgi:hypothetical protein